MVKIGVDYYPEHWDKSLWDSDIDLMVKTGVKVVRIAEFAWSRLEPREGEFDFSWLDEIIAKFSEKGLEIILGTPTNCAPVWMYRKYPETLMTERTGQRTETGIRGHRCYTSPVFRDFAARIIRLMAERYGSLPCVTAWQIDNELEAHHCNCEHCTDAFRAFLENKYGTTDSLNAAYGNDVWSGDFSDFSEVKTPLGDKYKYGWLNPSFMLDYERFASGLTVDYVKFQRDVIRGICPDAVITTNSCISAHTPDFYRIFNELDVAAYDNYPSLYGLKGAVNVAHAFNLDLVRGFKRRNYWLAEQMSGSFGCWAPISPAPRPGAIKGYAMQAVAHGADLLLHFRWRTSVKGAEMFCHGLLDHHNIPGRRFKEFAELCAEINVLKIPEDAEVQSDIAFLFSFEQDFAFNVQEMSEGFTYRRQAELLHAAYRSFGLNIDVIEETADITDYKIVVVPSHFVSDRAVIESLENFTRGGGTVIVTNRSGVKDKFNACLMSELPGGLANLCGTVVAEYDAIGDNIVPVKGQGGKEYEATCWCDILEPRGAEVIAEYDGEFYKGKAGAVRNAFGKGCCYYLGFIGDADFYKDLARETLRGAGLTFTEGLPEGVEITVRRNAEYGYTFVFNNNHSGCTADYRGQRMELAPFECRVIKDRI